jgi:hypothetical protein
MRGGGFKEKPPYLREDETLSGVQLRPQTRKVREHWPTIERNPIL